MFNPQTSSNPSTTNFPTPNSVFSTYDESMCRFNHENLNNTSVRHSDVEVGFHAEVPLLAELPKLSENVNLEELLAHIRRGFESRNWQERFQTVNEVRSLYKNMPERVNSIMECFIRYLLRGLSDSKSSVVKVTIVALTDFFEHTREFPINFASTSEVLNFLVSKSVAGVGVFKQAIEKCANALIINCGCDGLVQQLCELATNRNPKVGWCGFQYLGFALNNLKENVSNLNERTNQMIFKTTSFVMETQRFGESKNLARNILKFYWDRMGEEGFKGFLVYMMEGGFLSREDALRIYVTATKLDKVTYPRLSTFVEQNRASMGQPRQSMFC